MVDRIQLQSYCGMIGIPYFFDQMPWLQFFLLLVFLWLLFEGGYYSRVATIQGWLLFEGGYYSRVATI